MNKIALLLGAAVLCGTLTAAECRWLNKELPASKTELKQWWRQSPAGGTITFLENGGPDGRNAVELNGKELKKNCQLVLYFSPEDLKGKKVRLSAQCKAENVGASNALRGIKFMVNYQLEGSPNWNFGEGKFPKKGSFDWMPIETVKDIPENASKLAIYIAVQGTGKVTFSDIRLEILEK